MKKITYTITGMHCKSCAFGLEEDFRELNGVIKAKVDFHNKQATIEFDDQVLQETSLEEAIRSSGFDFN